MPVLVGGGGGGGGTGYGGDLTKNKNLGSNFPILEIRFQFKVPYFGIRF